MQKVTDVLINAKRLNAILWKNRKSFLLFSIVFSIISALIPYATSGVNALLVNHLTTTAGAGISDTLLVLALTSAILFFIPDIVSSINTWVEKRIWVDIGQIIQLQYLKKKGEIDIQTYEDPKFLDTLNKAEDRGVWPTTNFLSLQFNAFGNIIGLITGLGILLFFNWMICLLIIIAIIPQFIVEIKFNNDTWGIWNADAATRRRFNNLRDHFEQKNWLIELKLFQNVHLFYTQIKEILISFNDKQRNIERTKLFFEIGSTILSGAIIGGVIIWVVLNVAKGDSSIGALLFLMTSISQLQGSLIAFLSRLARLHEYSLYCADIFKVLSTSPALPRAQHPVTLTGETPEIIFENVSFAYPSSPEKLTLEHISLTIRKGEKFALVGENGAGKTTFVKLLCRIYDPTEGRILVDGVDLRKIDLESWYKTLGILFQEYAPYKFAVKDSIALGRSDDPFDFERIQNAALASESDSFIQQWPQKYDQQLGTEFDQGIDPSKGQQQRLAIARLMHRKAGVLILDEPTAAIDAEAEKKIFDQIEREAKNQTVILISHKFSTVKNADRICVFKGKTVHEMGSHEELLRKKGTYARLFSEQAEAYTI